MGTAPRMPGGKGAKEIAIYSVISGLNQTCVCSTLDNVKTVWAQGNVTGKYIKRSGYDFVALKRGKYVLKNRFKSVEKYCEVGEVIGTSNYDYADIWVCIAL